jgi:hypothetical protein
MSHAEWSRRCGQKIAEDRSAQTLNKYSAERRGFADKLAKSSAIRGLATQGKPAVGEKDISSVF